MRIVRMANYVGPRSGGMRTALRELGNGYREAGHEPVLIIPGPRASDEHSGQGRVITLRGPVVPLTGGYRALLQRRSLGKLLEELKPDRLEVSDRTTLRWTGRWARRHGVPAVMVSHESLTGLFSLPADVSVTINTLQDVLFLDRINDISFEIGGKLVVLIEHQSTINPNMALRLLLYIARVYEKIIGDKNIYESKLVTIPRPEFFVLYNGLSPFPDEKIVKLSDSFENTGSLGLSEKLPLALELAVKVVNINCGKNEVLAQKCKTLAGYSMFVAKVREFEKECGDKTESVKRAVKYCRDNNILRDFFEQNGSEVMNMLMTEWNWDDALAVRFEEGREEGREEIARNALAEGLSPEVICAITGLDTETIMTLQAR